MRFLIIRFSSIGDIVLTTPLIRCLKLQFPDAEIHYLTKHQYKIVLENNPYIDKIHVLDKGIVAKCKELKKEHFDCIIDLHKNLRTLLFKIVLFKKTYSFKKLNFQKWLLVNLHINLLPKRHIVDRYLDTVQSLGVNNDEAGLDYFLPSPFSKPHINLPTQFIAIAIGAQHATKRLPLEKLIELCNLIKMPVILLGGKEDQKNGELIVEQLGEKVINTCGKFNLNESAYIIQQATQVITHDTGLMHIAAAFQKEIISIWGNTIPAFGMTPYFGNQPNKSAIFEVQDLNCRPCSKIGFNQCPKKHFDCMNKQPIQGIVSVIQQ